MTTQTGTVKWFNDFRGFGFIAPDNGGRELFTHFRDIQLGGFKSLARDQRVKFEVQLGFRGIQASNIRAIC